MPVDNVHFGENLLNGANKDKETQSNKTVYTKTENYPEDTVELSNKTGDEEKKKILSFKIAAGAVAAAAVIGLGVAGRKGIFGKAVKKFLGGAEEAGEKIKHNNGASDGKTSEPPSVKPETTETAPRNDNPSAPDSKITQTPEHAEVPVPEWAGDMSRTAFDSGVHSINISMKSVYGIEDNEIAELLMKNAMKNGKFDNNAVIDMFYKNSEVENIIKEAFSTSSTPQEKEKWLSKLFKISKEKVEDYNSASKMDDLYFVQTELRKLYKNKRAKFNLKDTLLEDVSSKLEEIYHNTKEAQNLDELLGSKSDYELFRQLSKSSDNYVDFFQRKTNPMLDLKYMSNS